MVEKITGVLLLNSSIFNQIEHDRKSTLQAAIIVLIMAIIAAINSASIAKGQRELAAEIGISLEGNEIFTAGENPIETVVLSFLSVFFIWALWSFGIYTVGTKMFKSQVTFDGVFRVIGFSMIPRTLGIIGSGFGFVGLLWSIVASFVGVRQGLKLDRRRLILTLFFSIVFVVVANSFISVIISLILDPVLVGLPKRIVNEFIAYYSDVFDFVGAIVLVCVLPLVLFFVIGASAGGSNNAGTSSSTEITESKEDLKQRKWREWYDEHNNNSQYL